MYIVPEPVLAEDSDVTGCAKDTNKVSQAGGMYFTFGYVLASYNTQFNCIMYVALKPALVEYSNMVDNVENTYKLSQTHGMITKHIK